MGKLKLRKYFCPWCEHTTETHTNHEGEIYPGCKNCGSGVLYHRYPMHPDTKKAKIHTYYLSLIKDEDEERYQDIISECSMAGYKLWETNSDFLTPSQRRAWIKALREHMLEGGLEVTLFNPNQFDNQYVSNLGRLHQWYEFKVPNSDIKIGYYLEI